MSKLSSLATARNLAAILIFCLAGSPSAPRIIRYDAVAGLRSVKIEVTNTMPVTFERIDKSKILVKGATTLKMTDFGIKPPALTVLGIGIKTGDDVKLTFEWTTAKAEGK